MSTTRLSMLEKFVSENPNDPFPRYGLALELKNAGRLEEADRAFAVLRERFPDYVPAYLHAGNTLKALGHKDSAQDAYRAGIEAATRKQDAHARGELEGALAELVGQEG